MSELVESHQQRNSSEDAADRNTSEKISLRDNPMRTPTSEKELVYTSTEGQPTAMNQSTSTTRIVIATIIGGWLLAVAFAFAHHEFGKAMNGRTVPEYPKSKKLLEFHPLSQDSIKSAATAFVRGVVLSLTVAAGGVLTQMVCIIPSAHFHVTIYISHTNVFSRYRSGVFQPSTPSHWKNSTRSSSFLLLSRPPPFFSLPSLDISG